MLEDVLRKWNGLEVSAMEVYSDVFRLGENEIQRNGEPKGQFKANPVGYWSNNGQKGHFRIFFDDIFEETLKELQEADFAILNGLTYFGRKNVQAHASKVYALIFDLDGVTDKTLNAFLNGAFEVDAYPIPNYIALSGHGVHLYYVMEEPVSLFPYMKIQMKELKYALTEKIWNMYTSTDDHKQFQGINQGFRVIGGKTKIEGVRVRAFRINSHPFSVSQLNKYIPRESRIDETKLWKESRMTLEEARKKYPEWYEEKVVRKSPRRYWQCKEDLYEWWKRKILEGATYHHRYFLIMCLAIYGVKCGKSFEDVEKDAYELVPFLNAVNPSDPFTEEDCQSALECFDPKYCTFPIDDIVKISGILIEKNKRNGLKQEQHLYLARRRKEDMKAIELPMKALEGRPRGSSQQKIVVTEWRYNNPKGKPKDCILATGISKNTVYRWWKEAY
ncbi:MAG TPA: hypothetical protein DCS54_06135 [Oribacterium sp.]|nr:hypothetical protein [Oribacterium sp.]